MTSASDIICVTCNVFDITREQFFGFLTRDHLKRARFAAAYVIAEKTTLKGSQLTRALGRSSDAAVARNMLARAGALIANDPAFAEQVSIIKESVGAGLTVPPPKAPSPVPVMPAARKEPDEPPDVVEMRRMINAGTDLLRQAMLRERSPANAAGDAT